MLEMFSAMGQPRKTNDPTAKSHGARIGLRSDQDQESTDHRCRARAIGSLLTGGAVDMTRKGKRE